MPNKSDMIDRLMGYKLIYSMTGLVLGSTCIIGGILLFLNGVSGSSSLTAKILGNESNLTDAAPGAILFVVGLFIVLVTRYSPKVEYETESETENVIPDEGTRKIRGKARETTKVKAKASAKAKKSR